MKQAFVSIGVQAKKLRGQEIAVIVETAAVAGIAPFVFVNEYEFSPEQLKEMMAATMRHVQAADFLIAEVSEKAIGVGIEVGMAAALNKPIVYLRHTGAEASTTVGGLATYSIVYENPDDLKAKLAPIIEALKGE